MKIDVQSLGTLNELAHGGAKEATRAMAQMTGIDGDVSVTQITIVDREDIGEELLGQEFVGVQFGFQGELAGDAVLVFETGTTDAVVESLVGPVDDESMVRSSVKEIGNIMMSGFIDGWADYLGTTIDHSPPEYIEREGADILPSGPADATHEQVFVFRSEISWTGEATNFYIYMLPEYDPLAAMMPDDAGEQDAIPLEKLQAFKELTQRGTENAAENVEMLSGIATDAEVTRITFSPIEDVPMRLGEDVIVGTVVELTGKPSGYLMVLFDETSARTVAEELMPVDLDTAELTEQHEAAIEELGNIMTSGFVDGWANVLQRSIDHSPPRLVHDMGRAVVDPLAAQLGQHQQHAFIIDSQMRTENLDFHSEIHALPDEAELREALDELLVDRIDETEADVEQIF